MEEEEPMVLFGLKCLPVEDIVCKASVWIHRVVPTGMVAVGTVGNIINIVVLSRKKLRATPCFLLVFLSVFDLLFLWFFYSQSALNFGFEIDSRALLGPYFIIQAWASAWLGTSSLWTVAMFTVERMLFALFPHRTSIHLNRNKSIGLMGIIVILMGGLLGLANFGLAPELELRNNGSDTNLTSNGTMTTGPPRTGLGLFDNPIIHILVFIFCQMIPVLIIISGNIALLVHLYKARVVGASADPQTKLLLLVTGLMLCTFVPFGIFLVTIQVLSFYLDQSYPLIELFFAIINSLVMCNHSLNFVLYAWKGTLFKRECRKIWKEFKTLKYKCTCTCRCCYK